MRLATLLVMSSLIVLATGCPDRVTRESTAAAATLDPMPPGPPTPTPTPVPAASDAGVPAAPGLLDGGIIRDGGGLKDGMSPPLDGRATPS